MASETWFVEAGTDFYSIDSGQPSGLPAWWARLVIRTVARTELFN
jgi:hypothetical protein